MTKRMEMNEEMMTMVNGGSDVIEDRLQKNHYYNGLIN